MTGGDAERQSFSDSFDDEFPIGLHEGNCAFFGRDVLRGLVMGIDDFIRVRQPRWKHSRSLGPVLLGSAMFHRSWNQKWGYAGAFADPDGHMWQVSRADGFLTR